MSKEPELTQSDFDAQRFAAAALSLMHHQMAGKQVAFVSCVTDLDGAVNVVISKNMSRAQLADVIRHLQLKLGDVP